jgi:hypothetical protein
MPQIAQIELEYLMTVHADLAPAHIVDAGSRIVNVNGGWADGPADGAYFVVAPTFRTGAEKYAWLNRVQAVGKMVQLSFDPANRFVKYDFFVVR